MTPSSLNNLIFVTKVNGDVVKLFPTETLLNSWIAKSGTMTYDRFFEEYRIIRIPQ